MGHVVPSRMAGTCLLLLAGAGCSGGSAGLPPGPVPSGTYRLYVTNESSDLVSRVAFTPGQGAWVEAEIPVGIMPGDVDGPHGVAVAPDGSHLYVTIAHGTPHGSVWKLRAGSDSVEARTPLGRFPASASLTPDGRFLFVVNFNLHGDPVPSDLSVVFTPTLQEIARVPSCVMPHGGRVNASGTRHYHVCMHSDQLVEVAIPSMGVERRISLHPDHPGLLDPSDTGGGHGADHAAGAVCSPTWVVPGAGVRADRTAYVACNRMDALVEVELETGRIVRSFPTGRGPYNLDLTPDGRTLVATLKGGQAIVVIDLESGATVAELPTSRSVTHGVVISPDGRWAFVTNESIGGDPGTLDVFDLHRLERTASVELALQPGGVALWRVDPEGALPPAPPR